MTDYTATTINDESGLTDIRITQDGRKKHMWGKFGQRKETELAETIDGESIPLLIGSGIGTAARILAGQPDRPLFILDCEKTILEQTKLKESLRSHPNVIWITTSSPLNAARHIAELEVNFKKKIQLLKIPFYLRLSPFYAQVEKLILAEVGKAPEFPDWPKFQNEKPRILLLTSQYFLMGEIVSACERQSVPHMFINMDTKEMDLEQFVTRITSAINTFRPDFVLTVNHLGVDQEGVLNTLLHKFKLPLASWFVDNPMLILPLYKAQADSNTTLFTWDADRMDALKTMGYRNIFHMPLGTDQTRFRPSKGCQDTRWARDISFVGNSMVHKTNKRMEAARLPAQLIEKWKEVAHWFGKKSEPSVFNFLKTDYPELVAHYENLLSPYRKLAFETLIIWQATLEYRLSCIKKTLDFSPLIVGDDGWKQLLPNNHSWEYHNELSYYDDLPRFYPCSKINFNCTSQQMKGAVNQRVFDVPACNGFILTDHRYQVENLFEPGKEIAIYHSLEEIPQLIEKYLNDDDARRKIIEAGRKRILAQHTYDCRIKTLIDCMRQTYS
ncbi:CgeB family protein [Maridesulfovibrio hydrothermalis]|uniref:CgeB family protein n=1 Tax=Maridesulfovibrio hydrothermalis AM13 = DSM 14728 TaxID=1121451 RepID=L0R8V3_9BACT|nr:glycosyltransferase [Maridesulfovibrio hydrothermalis]CCO22657.1 CgeB family protein [Maridesulfovibrio hydrothermalis AM13 = DSM 14728]